MQKRPDFTNVGKPPPHGKERPFHGMQPCIQCGAAPLVHFITETVYEADPDNGAEIVVYTGTTRHERRTFTAKDEGICLIECPNQCQGIEHLDFAGAAAEWNWPPLRKLDEEPLLV